jgi:hypothetical protein
LLISNLLQSQEVTPSSPHSIMRWLLESAEVFASVLFNYRTRAVERYYSSMNAQIVLSKESVVTRT